MTGVQSATRLPFQQSLIQPDPTGRDTPWNEPLSVGIDEVGIGPLAGPVVAAAVILDAARPLPGLTDSKALTDKRRRALVADIRQHAVAWGIGWAGVEEIDDLNILRASHLAMQRACAELAPAPVRAFVDGNKVPALGMPCVAIVKGDRLVPAISAASILAKVARDDYMVRLDQDYPDYGFASHKGYPTRQHLQALRQAGITPHHRMSFAPVRAAAQAGCE